jgi:hypothetical protein
MFFRARLLIVLSVTLMSPAVINAVEIHPPQLGAQITIQGQRFNGDHLNNPLTGYTVPESKFAIRHATIEAVGTIGEYIEYNIEAGSATCLGSGQFQLMEAGVFYKPIESMRVGLMKGHMLRGFELREECVEVLTAEKPRFAKTFSPCHPTGAVVDLDYDFGGSMGLTAQFAYLNGELTQNLDDEHDMHLGVIFRTPYPGLSVGGYYNDVKKVFVAPDEKGKGHRMGLGADFDAHNILFRGEYYLLKGFTNLTCYEDPAHTILVDHEDLEMNAFYVQGGYTFNTNLEPLPYLRPYMRYQSWDKASNADGDHVFSYVTMGITVGLDEGMHTLFRVDYETPITTPDELEEDASLLIVRLQTGF